MGSDFLDVLLEVGRVVRNDNTTPEELLSACERILVEHLAPMGLKLSLGSGVVEGVDGEPQTFAIGIGHQLCVWGLDRLRFQDTEYKRVSDLLLDVSARLKARLTILEMTRRRHELQLKSQALESMFNAFDIVDDKGKFLYVNRAYVDMWGYDSKEEILGTSPATHCADPEVPAHIISVLREHGQGDFAFVGRRKDGSTFDVEMYCRLFPDWQGRELFTGVSIDVTERNELRRKYLQAQKMEAVGQLTGGVAHDFNNLLHVILGGLHFTLGDLENESPFRKDLENAFNAGKQASELVKQLLLFSRRQQHEPELLDLNSIIPNVIKMLDRLMGDHIDVRYEAVGKVGLLEADRSMLEQVLVNLAINARDALQPEGGRVTITVDDVDLQDELILTAHNVSPGLYCRLQVQDNGAGIAPDVQERIFEPFFSTKTESGGSGLGLATVYGIARRHSGFVSVESEVGKGTTMSVFFWGSQDGKLSHAPAQSEPHTFSSGEGRLVLLVDDNPQVRDLVRRVLTSEGYRVVAAADGNEGIKAYQDSQEEISLVITDLSMPGMGGLEMLSHLQQRYPDLKAILATGYSDSSMLRSAEVSKDVPVLRKPFSKPALLRLVESSLHGDR
jgi:PAS domain S-box-containing protein